MLADQYPDVNFIVPHLGGFAADWMVHLQVVDQLARLPNVYGGTSGVRYFDALVLGVRRGSRECQCAALRSGHGLETRARLRTGKRR